MTHTFTAIMGSMRPAIPALACARAPMPCRSEIPVGLRTRGRRGRGSELRHRIRAHDWQCARRSPLVARRRLRPKRHGRMSCRYHICSMLAAWHALRGYDLPNEGGWSMRSVERHGLQAGAGNLGRHSAIPLSFADPSGIDASLACERHGVQSRC